MAYRPLVIWVIFVVQKGITLTPQVGKFELLKIERGKLTWSKNLNVRISKILGISCDNQPSQILQSNIVGHPRNPLNEVL